MPDAHKAASAGAYSYRDPSGFVFEAGGTFYRQVNKLFAEDFEQFVTGGCYEKLVHEGLLLPHERVAENLTGQAGWHTTLRLEKIPFVSYPYEWSFDMLRDTALGTLRLMRETMDFGITLKDATPYNWQWFRGRLMFVDTLSFCRYNPSEPWIAYRQFCESFLAPLLLMHHRKESLQQLFLAHPDGIPLRIAGALLPWKTRFSLHTYLHIHLNAKIAGRADRGSEKQFHFSRKKMLNLISSLEQLVGGLRLPDRKTEWSHYFEEAALREDYLARKKDLVSEWIAQLPQPELALDIGANEGAFCMLLARRSRHTVAADQDPYCINRLYRKVRGQQDPNIQPLVLDVANPSPALGILNRERQAFLQRGRCDLVLALGLIHHLVIGRNIPLPLLAELFAGLGKFLVIEFIPGDDEKLRHMLQQKKGVSHPYDKTLFEAAFREKFEVLATESPGSSGRILYLMKRQAMKSP
ncbi:MAG TPA: class I SAM-dependent methyltransferase [Chitinophagaceae bacterium]|nr:class I SAM-dependent methyltransferase [Chitinophagaceae bacterium]